MVEFCTSTREMTEDDRKQALTLLEDPNPAYRSDAKPVFYKAADYEAGS